ncbi:MAG: sulfatase-like hydrolase/transferase, partial [Akkermansiaceae bacterium]|nr:sulfatase-like hydrolase/transferase [Akkermansiaceae bacterium]
LYKREDFSLPDNLGFPPGYPDWARNKSAGELRAYSDIPPEGLPTGFPSGLNQRLIHGYYACVSYVDNNVGRLLAALDQSGASDNTIVVFWADHGWKLGDHSSWCKHTNFECDARVPLIIRRPGGPAGVTRALVELIDLYPTLCGLCGLDLPDHLQGKSFEPVLDHPKAPHREFAYTSYPAKPGKESPGTVGHSIRTPVYRYTEWWENGTDRVVSSVLTNLREDPGETTNALPKKKGFAKALAVKLKARVLSARK